MDEHIETLRAAFHAGATIQAWTLDDAIRELHPSTVTSADGYWRDLSTEGEPKFSCPVHLYRVKPEGLL